MELGNKFKKKKTIEKYFGNFAIVAVKFTLFNSKIGNISQILPILKFLQ